MHQQELYVIFLMEFHPFTFQMSPCVFFPFAFRLCLVLTTATPLGTTSRMFHFCKFSMMIFLFPRWDMLVPWRVSLLILKHSFIARWHIAPAASDSLSLSLSLSPSLCVSIFTNAQTHNLHVCIYILYDIDMDVQ